MFRQYGVVKSSIQRPPIATDTYSSLNELSMDFVTGLPIFTDWKGDIYDLILAIVGRLTKMVHHELVHITIDASGLAEPILDKRQVTEEKRLQISIWYEQRKPRNEKRVGWIAHLVFCRFHLGGACNGGFICRALSTLFKYTIPGS